jgi:hypothetical protein
MAWDHAWCTEWRVAFVSRTLDDAEHTRYAEHLPHCPECTLAIADLADDVALLSLGVTPLEPGPLLDPVAAASRIVAASSAVRMVEVESSGLATAVAVDVDEALGLLEILRDASGTRWAARLRGVPHAAERFRFRLAYVDDAFEVGRRTLAADGSVALLRLSPEATSVRGATLTVERNGDGGVVVGHLVVGLQ